MVEQDRTPRILTREEATHVERPDFPGPWVWPEVVQVAISDSFKVQGRTGMKAANGDPLSMAFAVNFFETLYDNGYAIVQLFGGDAQ